MDRRRFFADSFHIEIAPSLLRNDFVGRYINRPQAGSVSDLSWEARRIIIYYSFRIYSLT